MIELAVAIVIIAAVLAIILPSLSAARRGSHREQCVNNQALLGKAWSAYLADHNRQFPVLVNQPAWQWGGVRFSAITDEPHLDFNRPLTYYVSAPSSDRSATNLFRCPGDRGITSDLLEAGTGGRTAFRSFGTSYRANAFLLSGTSFDRGDSAPIARDALLAAPASMVLLGDAGWYEQLHSTGRQAHWHGEDGLCNLLFLDGSVQLRRVGPGAEPSAIVFECAVRDPNTAEAHDD
jgi:prepilin-type processing-associated H-X9-DG protein